MCDKLNEMYEGINQVKEIRTSMIVHEYEIFKIEEGERAEQMFERLFFIVNGLHALGRIIFERELNIKFLKTLLRSLQSKVDAIQEGNDLATLSYDELRGKLLAYERTYMRESLDLRRNKNVAFQASHRLEDDDEDPNFEIKSQDHEMA